MFILDIGSGNTLTDTETACKIIKTIQDLQIPNSYVKFQLFKEAGDNIPLNTEVFKRASHYAHVIGMPMGVSVFDEESLDVGIHSGAIGFVKLANNPKAHKLLDKIPEADRAIISTDDPNFKVSRSNTDIIYCISKYPAEEKDYDKFGDKLKKGMSDHTTSWNLFKKYQPKIYECHFCLPESKGLDAGKFARRPKDFKEILNLQTTATDILQEEYEREVLIKDQHDKEIKRKDKESLN